MKNTLPVPSPLPSALRRLAWLLVFALAADALPLEAFAQDAPAPDASALRERVARARARRNAPRVPGPGETASAPSPGAGGRDETGESVTPEGDRVYQLKLKDAPLDLLLDRYSELTGRTMIKAPGINATVNFSAAGYLTRDEMMQAMDAILTMNNITLVPLGEQFYRVVQIDKSATEGLKMNDEAITEEGAESDAVIRRLVKLNYLGMEDAVNLVQPMLHGYGKVVRLDRISSLMILETAANLKSILDVLEMVDQPTELKVETKIYEIKHAKAADIASRLSELANEAQQGNNNESTPQVAQVAPPGIRRAPNMIRARQPQPPGEEGGGGDARSREAAAAEKGIIQGKVKILTDERTNIIIVISDPVNFKFFDKIVEVLDVSVDPEVIVEVVALQFADAEETASLLNDFIGASNSSSQDNKSSSASTSNNDGDSAPGNRRAARAIDEIVRQRASAADRARNTVAEAAKTSLGQISESTKILSDKRTNTLLLMGTKSDIAALRDVIAKVDIMLAQVLIEAVILEVDLNNSTDYGFKWLQKSMTAYHDRAVGSGLTASTPVASWGGGFGGADFSSLAGDTISRASSLGSSLTYYLTFNELNIDAVLTMLASSGETRVLATPVILTTDNTEAKIMSGEQVPIRTGDTTSSSYTYSDYEYKDVGIQLDVKPRINPERYVTLELTQTSDTLGDQTDVGNGNTMYRINKREMTASVSVPSRSTIVLGGLVQTSAENSESRVPILGSIPILGALFRSSSKSQRRTELLVLITPYVLRTPEEARAETERLHRASNVAPEDWYRGWSDSPLAPLSPEEAKARDAAEKRRKMQEKKAAEKAAADRARMNPVNVVSPGSAEAGGMAARTPYVFDASVEPDLGEEEGEADSAPEEQPPEKTSLFHFRRKKSSDAEMPSMFPAPGVNDRMPTLGEAGLFRDVTEGESPAEESAPPEEPAAAAPDPATAPDPDESADASD
jgi:general secretion pathway protein D